MGQEWEQSGHKVAKSGTRMRTKSDKIGNKVGTRAPKRDKNGNKVGTKWEEERQGAQEWELLLKLTQSLWTPPVHNGQWKVKQTLPVQGGRAEIILHKNSERALRVGSDKTVPWKGKRQKVLWPIDLKKFKKCRNHSNDATNMIALHSHFSRNGQRLVRGQFRSLVD